MSIRWIQRNADKVLSEIRQQLLDEECEPLKTKVLHLDRDLHIRAARDRIPEQAVALILQAIVEPVLHDHVMAYRPKRSQWNAIHLLRARNQFDTVIHIDIRHFFEEVSHNLVLTGLRPLIQERKFFDLLTKFLTSAESSPGRGLGQGTILGPILSNIALNKLDRLFPEAIGVLAPQALAEAGLLLADDALFRPPTGKSSGGLTGLVVLYVRYADDLLLLVRGDQVQANRLRRLVELKLQKMGLALQPRKTRIGRVSDGFDFLGIRFAPDEMTITTMKLQEWVNKAATEEKDLQAFVNGCLGNYRQWGVRTDDVHARVKALAAAGHCLRPFARAKSGTRVAGLGRDQLTVHPLAPGASSPERPCP